MNNHMFLDKEKINNYTLVMDTILNHGRKPQYLSVENIGDLISILNGNDKKRSPNDPELKKAVFTVVKGMLDSGIVELWWEYCWVRSVRESPPKSERELFNFLDEYWDKTDISGLDRTYLLWFNKKGNAIARGLDKSTD